MTRSLDAEEKAILALKRVEALRLALHAQNDWKPGQAEELIDRPFVAASNGQPIENDPSSDAFENVLLWEYQSAKRAVRELKNALKTAGPDSAYYKANQPQLARLEAKAIEAEVRLLADTPREEEKRMD